MKRANNICVCSSLIRENEMHIWNVMMNHKALNFIFSCLSPMFITRHDLFSIQFDSIINSLIIMIYSYYYLYYPYSEMFELRNVKIIPSNIPIQKFPLDLCNCHAIYKLNIKSTPFHIKIHTKIRWIRIILMWKSEVLMFNVKYQFHLTQKTQFGIAAVLKKNKLQPTTIPLKTTKMINTNSLIVHLYFNKQIKT